MSDIIKETKDEMTNVNKQLEDKLKNVRTGRAHKNMLDNVKVDAYNDGNQMPIASVGTVTTPDNQTLLITSWDSSVVPAVEKALIAADLGMNPQVEKNSIRLKVPQPDEESRKKTVKQTKEMGETFKVAVRNKRKEANDKIKKAKNNNEITEDDVKRLEKEVQTETDKAIKDIDQKLSEKEKEITKI